MRIRRSMMIRPRRTVASCVSALLSMALLSTPTSGFSTPLGTAFTYQGQLKQSGTPVNATADFEFRIFASSGGGTPLGSMVPINGHTVTDGEFSMSLDFGASALNGDARWLEIAVRSPAGGGTFTTLTPRQRITPTPYALQTRGMFVDSNNNVGIGTTTPAVPLHLIAPNSGPTPGEGIRIQGTQSTGDNQAYLSFANGAGTAIGYVGDGGGTENNIYLGAYGADIGLVNSTFGTVLIAKANGNVGIGTSTPANRLSVVGDANISGRIGIGTSNPSAQLDVAATPNIVAGDFHSNNGNTSVRGVNQGTGNGVEGIALNGIGMEGNGGIADFIATGPGTNYAASSSARWKSNVAAIGDPLAMLSQLRGVYFNWDADHGGQHDVGMIAEEVGKVLPEIVVYEASGTDASGMDYSKLTPLLVEAVKALRAEKDAEIAALRQENAQLRVDHESATTKLHDRIASLEATIQELAAATKGTHR